MQFSGGGILTKEKVQKTTLETAIQSKKKKHGNNNHSFAVPKSAVDCAIELKIY